MNKGIKNILKTKGFYIALASGLCMIAVLGYTMSGIQNAGNRLNELNQAKQEMDDTSNDISSNFEVADNFGEDIEEEVTEEEVIESQEDVVEQDSIQTQVVDESDEVSDENIVTEELAQVELEDVSEESENSSISEETTKENESNNTVEVIGTDNILNSLAFDEETGLAWPVNGDVIKNYSVDSLVYFQTMGQFKSNPAIFIASDVGTEVNAACKGVVTNIYNSSEFGNVVEVSIGNDYVLTYGQIENICVANGDKINEGDAIGCIANPTGYYTQEGSHLYFKVAQDDESVNPLLLLR